MTSNIRVGLRVSHPGGPLLERDTEMSSGLVPSTDKADRAQQGHSARPTSGLVAPDLLWETSRYVPPKGPFTEQGAVLGSPVEAPREEFPAHTEVGICFKAMWGRERRRPGSCVDVGDGGFPEAYLGPHHQLV